MNPYFEKFRNMDPYFKIDEDENILNKTGWKSKDVTITEIKQYQGEE